jgi:hypothetical protein
MREGREIGREGGRRGREGEKEAHLLSLSLGPLLLFPQQSARFLL